MPSYLPPGVHVDELPAGTPPLSAPSHSTPVFIGTGGNPSAPIGEPTMVHGWLEYARTFLGEGATTYLSHAVKGFFHNTEGRCYILDVGRGGSLSGAARSPGLNVLEGVDDISMVCAPGYTSRADHENVIAHCEQTLDRVAILDPSPGCGPAPTPPEASISPPPGRVQRYVAFSVLSVGCPTPTRFN